MINSKGQESGPFELLIAVVMMAFVLIVGYQAIEIVKFNDCLQQNDKMLEDFRTVLEDITTASMSNNIALNFQACAPKEKQNFSLIIQQDPLICNDFCNTPKPTCVLLKLYNPKFSKTKCVDMPSETNFNTDPNACGRKEGYELIDLRSQSTTPQGILEGFWSFKNVSSNTNSSSSSICAFRQCFGEAGCV